MLTIPMIRAEIGDCRRCTLCEHRTSIVIGSGNPTARLMIIDEAPGRFDDRLGSPLVGPTGIAIDRYLRGIGMTRADVYVTHLVKCRPLAQRLPSREEILACRPFLRRQIEAVNPRVILALGRTASNQIVGNGAPLIALRGRWYDLPGREGVTRVVPSLHPAFVAIHPPYEDDIRDDFELARRCL